MTAAIACDIPFTIPAEMIKPWIQYMADQVEILPDVCYMVYNPMCVNWTLTAKADFILKTLAPEYKLKMSDGDNYATNRDDPMLYKMLRICHKLDIRVAKNFDGSFSDLDWCENNIKKAEYAHIEIEFCDGHVGEISRVYAAAYKISQIIEILEAFNDTDSSGELCKKILAVCKADI